MEIQEIKEQLKPIFENVFSTPGIEITESLDATQVERWDSLTHLTMIAETESHFGIKFKLKELIAMKNVGDMIQLIQQKTTG